MEYAAQVVRTHLNKRQDTYFSVEKADRFYRILAGILAGSSWSCAPFVVTLYMFDTRNGSACGRSTTGGTTWQGKHRIQAWQQAG